MTDFYNEKLKAIKHLDRLLKQAEQDNVEVSADKVIFELTGFYAVSEAMLKKRMQQFEALGEKPFIKW